MIHYVKGDLLKSDCKVIVHQCNCQSVMGAGIAAVIAKVYKHARDVDYYSKMTPEEKFGKYTSSTKYGITVANLYGQFRFGRGLQTNYDKLESAFDLFLTDAKENPKINLSKIGVPYKMGCDLAGGDWNKVYAILERMSEKHGVDIYTYHLEK